MRYSICCAALLAAMAVQGQINFQNVAAQSGIDYHGRTYGSSWGDVNNDGLMDLFISCHEHKSEPFFTHDSVRIYLNLGQGMFSDSIYYLENGHQSDFHGGLFLDMDNDGDQDLLLLTGGTKRNVLLLNDGSTYLADFAEERGIDLYRSRGRMATPLDVNNDGIPDVLVNHEVKNHPLGHSSVIMLGQENGNFVLANDMLGLEEIPCLSSTLSDLDTNGRPEVISICDDGLKIYRIGDQGQFILGSSLNYPLVNDMAIADFNGDLLPDIFLACGKTQEPDIQLYNDSLLLATMRVRGPLPPSSIIFRTEGLVNVELHRVKDDTLNIRLGSSQAILDIPATSHEEPFFTLTLDPNDPGLQGFQEPSDMAGAAIECAFGVMDDGRWRFMTGTHKMQGNTVILQLRTSHAITELETVGGATPGPESRDVLLINQGNLQFEASEDPVFQVAEYSMGVAAGDFDNDGDVDLVVVSAGRAKNRKARTYENLGNGHFAMQYDGWGITGEVPGIANGMSVTDYDNDGFLDVLAANGFTAYFLDSAAYCLYHNEGNENHWLKLALTGLQSTADALGARVVLETNGVQQAREVSGGVHGIQQDDPRPHFGLGTATVVDRIDIYWPSGTHDVLTQVPADQVLAVHEGDFHVGLEPVQDCRQRAHRAVLYDMAGRTIGNYRMDELRQLHAKGLPVGAYSATYLDRQGLPLYSEKMILTGY